ncbi:MAG: hypothetical protein Q4B28_00185 [bacterium]|nr:hypothetical protein [bacterium]
MKKNIKSFQKTFKNFKLIDPNKLLVKPDELESKKKSSCLQNNQKPEDYHHLFCKLYTLSDERMTPIIDLIYNELLRYTLFSSYYKSHLLKHTNPDDNTKAELKYLEYSHKNILTVTNQTLQQIADLHSSYPLHIGLLAYQEDLLKLRAKLNKLISPFYSLYYKLQNAQIPG